MDNKQMDKPTIDERLLIVDSREKWTQPNSTDKHISNYLTRNGIQWVVKKMDVGDYMTFGGFVSVDRKHSIEEIAKNLTNPRDKKRFMSEVRRAYQLRLRLVVLIESNKYTSIYDLRGWQSQFSPTNGNALIRQMERLGFAYGVRFEFCRSQSVARRIIEILGIEPVKPQRRNGNETQSC